MRQTAILHGWSDNSDSFKPLAQFLRDQGHVPVPVWLGDYISMDDDVGIEDVAKRMEEVVQSMQADGDLDKEFDLIVHSTGGLVARKWLVDYYGTTRTPPVRRLVMLAPANFGSRLAKTGKSLLGRAFKGFLNGFQTGRRMLDALELGSQFSWELARRDLLAADDEEDDGSRIYGEDRVLPFVIVGTRAYEELPRRLVNENGSDGTVRVSAANLNILGVTIDFSDDIQNPQIQQWAPRFSHRIPIAVLPDRDHASVTRPDTRDRGAVLGVVETLGDLILRALRCQTIAEYNTIAGDWCGEQPTSINERTAVAAEMAANLPGYDDDGPLGPEAFHQYMQIVCHVVDDHGSEVADYFLEYPGSTKLALDDAAEYFQSHVLEKVDVNEVSAARRTLFVDRTDLMAGYYAHTNVNALYLRVVAAALGDNVGYFIPPNEGDAADAIGLIQIHSQDKAVRWLTRNSTHLVKIIIPRVPDPGVFGLKAWS